MAQATPVVFIVDDDVSVRESLELLIDSAGWAAHTFASAQDFLAHRPVLQGPGCLLADVNLPDLTGLDLQARVGADRIDLPIVLMSGDDDVALAGRAVQSGAVAFLKKPLDAEALCRVIQQAFERSAALAIGEDPHAPS